MKPLEVQVLLEDDEEDEDEEEDEDADVEKGRRRGKPLLQRMADDKRHYLERGSLAGSAYFMVQLPDGTMERRMKMPLNVDPGVHSTFNLDQLVSGNNQMTPCPTMALLPTITEAKVTETGSTQGSENSREGSAEVEKKGNDNANNNDDNANSPLANIPEPIEEEKESEEEKSTSSDVKELPGIP